MKLSELMKDYTPSESYEGWVTNDDYVFAIDTAPNGSTATKEGDYVVVEMGIAGLDAQLNPITQDKTYIRAGQNTMKTGTQRAFSVTGDRYVGDEAQDYCLSHKTKYGKVIQDLKDHRDQLVLKDSQGQLVKTDKCSMRHVIPQPELQRKLQVWRLEHYLSKPEQQ